MPSVAQDQAPFDLLVEELSARHPVMGRVAMTYVALGREGQPDLSPQGIPRASTCL